jgi:DNA polymerase V
VDQPASMCGHRFLEDHCKLANHVAKKFALFDSVCDFSTMSAARMHWLLSRIDVREVWGVGRRSGDKLHEMGIKTVQALRDAPPREMRARFGVVMERTCNELRGMSCLALEEVAPPRQEIVSSRSFGAMTAMLDDLAQAVSMYVTRAAEKLRGQQSLCGAIHVFIHTNQFRQGDPQYRNGITVPLVESTDDSRILTEAALQGLETIFREGFLYKKAGVMVMDLGPRTARQGSLFEIVRQSERSTRMMAALDTVNLQYGRDTVQLGSAGIMQRWTIKADNRSQKFTTCWNELPTAHAN